MVARGGGGGSARAEVVKSKSPAEFFSENQNIAGFDNPGKSLYTTIRELVENSLDAAESIEVLPEISVAIEELTEAELNDMHGFETQKRVDQGLFKASDRKGPRTSQAAAAAAAKAAKGAAAGPEGGEAGPAATGEGEDAAAKDAQQGKKKKDRSFYRVTCEDNGCGMPHDKIPDMLGRVLSGSKYGVRQTRGKFGLGSKMALIWSKKSTGMPIEIESAHSTDPSRGPAYRSRCVLDIDIYRNEPQIRAHQKLPNADGWRGTRINVIVEGNWTTYKAHTLHYFQQLAIITPYAQIDVGFKSPSNPGRDCTTHYSRRSDQMPPPTKEVKHHPSSVNHLIVQQLLEHTKAKTLLSFLSSELACVDKKLAQRIVAELGKGFDESMSPSQLNNHKSVQLSNLLRSIAIFKPPDGSCLSPAGEYNLRLGIMKELRPDYVATVSEPASVFEGHPFIVEAGVSLGGLYVKDGINVYRFANRIPLLFEAGNDVVTQVANKRIRWINYHIDPHKERIGVFVSIVSTKIPFKGTGKEYIGDDIEEMQKSVKAALQRCCKQLKSHLLTRNAARESKQRKKSLLRYAPDAARALAGVLEGIRKRQRGNDEDDAEEGPGSQAGRSAKRQVLAAVQKEWEAQSESPLHAFLDEIADDELGLEARLRKCLEVTIEKVELESALEASTIGGEGGGHDKPEHVFIAPLKPDTRVTAELTHPACSVRFLISAMRC